MEELLKRCCDETGLEKAVVETAVSSFLGQIVKELSQGHTVDLGKGFGVFTPKLRTSHLQENSPRTPKDSRYKVVFREGAEMRQKLKVDGGAV